MVQSQTFYFSEGPYLQTLQGLHAALSNPEAFVKLLGGVQTGKSLLCDKLTQYMRRKGFQLIYFNSAVESPDMLRAILARELRLPVSSNFSRLLEDTLQLKDDKPIVLIFDDAHLLTDITLLEIYRLAEVQVNGARVLNVLLSGEPSLEKRLLSNQEFKTLLLSVTSRFVLEPMDRATLDQFFYRYAEKCGVPGLQLEVAAMNHLYKSCRGYPGPALSMCRLIVESRSGNTDIKPVTKAELVQSLKTVSGPGLAGKVLTGQNKTRALAPLAAVLAIASIGIMYQQLQPEQAVDASNATTETRIEQESPFQTRQQEIASNTESQSQLSSNNPAEDAVSAAMTATAEPEPVSAELMTLPVPTEIPEPVSDSSLALVTAAEIGISSATISEPEFEPLPENSDDELTESPETIATEVREIAVATDEGLQVSSTGIDAAEDAAEIAAPPEAVTNVSDTIDGTATDAATTAVSLAIEESTTFPSASVNSSATLTERLESSVESWLLAWQSQSLENYFASYHSQFMPRYQDSLDAWRSNRQRVIGNANSITLQMTDFEHVGMEEGLQDVRFWLRYQSPNYSDNTQKKLLMDEEEGSWKIVEEINLQVRR